MKKKKRKIKTDSEARGGRGRILVVVKHTDSRHRKRDAIPF